MVMDLFILSLETIQIFMNFKSSSISITVNFEINFIANHFHLMAKIFQQLNFFIS